MDVKEDELEVFHLFPLNVKTVDTFTWNILKLNTKKLALIREEKTLGYDFLTQESLLDSLLFFDDGIHTYTLKNPRSYLVDVNNRI